MSLKRMPLKLLSVISVMVTASLLIAACGSSAAAAFGQDGKIGICHATGITTAPYDQIRVGLTELSSHIDHKNDLIPAPADGCPKEVQTGGNTGKVSICHSTGSATNPYNLITIDFNGLRGHIKHQDDIIPAPKNGCPRVTVTPTINGSPTETLTPTIPMTPTTTPTITPTSNATMLVNKDGKITICHATGSKKNPYVMITISINGLNGHNGHARDIIPAPAGGCPN